MLRILFAARSERWDQYQGPLTQALAKVGLDAQLGTDLPPETVDYIVYAPNSHITDFTPFKRLKAVLNLWAGVEDVAGNPTLTVPLARMIEDGLTEGMTEWVTAHVLRHHLGLDLHIIRQDGTWDDRPPPLARDRTVAVLGLGQLGGAVATALAALNFRVLGWSRRPKTLHGIDTRSGAGGLAQTLGEAEIVVLLLPLTTETDGILDADRFAALRPGAVLLNPGRGGLVDDDALIAALDNGHLGHATLDVFRTEPLPADHPFWAHPGITVTPHIASATRVQTASEAIAVNIVRAEAGEPLKGLVDRHAGY